MRIKNPTSVTLPTVRSDLLLLHPPAFFDFRERDDIYFPYLSTSGDVPITPVYEYFPLGFKSLQRVLGERGVEVKILNLASLLLKYPRINVEMVLRSLEARVVGIDLHWMVHAQGSLAIAKVIKTLHPQSTILFGGTSATYFAEELIRYPFIDLVMRGYDTHLPMVALMEAVRSQGGWHRVENLIWKDAVGDVHDNGLTHKPKVLDHGIDWGTIPTWTPGRSFPIREVVLHQTIGCDYQCNWCGGARNAFQNINQLTTAERPVVRKSMEEIEREFRSIQEIEDVGQYHFYTVGSYNETPDRFNRLLNFVRDAEFQSISYEQHHLTPDSLLKKMGRCKPRTILTLSPDSHDPSIARRAGRGNYSMQEMEDWIQRALDFGIHQVDVWFMIGLPEQDAASVRGTVEYCQRLLTLFRGERVYPYICPMIPYLDPGSKFFEAPDHFGFRVFYRTVDDHRQAAERASLIHRINYETRWLSRSEIVRQGFSAVHQLTESKVESGIYPTGVGRSVCKRIEDALEFIDVVHAVDLIADPGSRQRALREIAADIRARNELVFSAGVANQAFPFQREVGGRWFDEYVWDGDQLEAAAMQGAPGMTRS